MNDDWYDLLVALLDADARFLVVGAHALAVHGVPRGTQDIDIWVDPDPGNTERVWRTLSVFGAPAKPHRRDALLVNKRASARRKDLADVEALGERPD